MTNDNISVFTHTQNQLGESPLWHPLLDTLFWVDIDKKLLFKKPLSSFKNAFDSDPKSLEMPNTVTALAWLDSQHLLLGTDVGIYRYHIENNTHELIAELENDQPNMRSNDGRADPWGGFWLSTMDVEATPGKGKIYRYFEKNITCLVQNLTIPNGICFDESRLRAYYSDSKAGCIYQFDLNNETGEVLGKPRLFYKFEESDLEPDGCIVDNKGNLWLAAWGKGCVICLSAKAEVLRIIEVNTVNPTCTAFGGKHAELLFVTSAMSETKGTIQSQQGNVIAIADMTNGRFEPPAKL